MHGLQASTPVAADLEDVEALVEDLDAVGDVEVGRKLLVQGLPHVGLPVTGHTRAEASETPRQACRADDLARRSYLLLLKLQSVAHLPEELWRVQDIRVQVHLVTLQEDLACHTSDA